MVLTDDEFSLYLDEGLTTPTSYNSNGDYFSKARDRIERSFRVMKSSVAGASVLDIGASPFYLLYLAQKHGAKACHGIYFSSDQHPLRDVERIYSRYGAIQIAHSNIETDDLPFGDNSLDLISACEILEHCEYFPSRISNEIYRVLRPGGMLLITVPNVSAIANILKLMSHRNIYMKYRSDPSGRHKHEYTRSQLKALVNYIGLDVVSAGVFPSPTSDKYWLRPAYRMLAKAPVLRSYSPVLYILARMPDPKPAKPPGEPPRELYDKASSIEE